MFDLVIFNFETGDASCIYWQELVLVNQDQMDYDEISEAFDHYEGSEDAEYADIVADILNKLGWEWKPFSVGSTIQTVWSLWG